MFPVFQFLHYLEEIRPRLRPADQRVSKRGIVGGSVISCSVQVMKGGRKNLKRAVGEETLNLQEGQSVMQVLSLRGSNIIEVMDDGGKKLLALFPAKFQKSMWIKRGSYVVVDESGREEALESGSKVACIVSQVLFHEQVRLFQKSPEWPAIFKSSILGTNGNLERPPIDQEENEIDLSDDDGLPPLEANTNRTKPLEMQYDTDSDSETDTGSNLARDS